MFGLLSGIGSVIGGVGSLIGNTRRRQKQTTVAAFDQAKVRTTYTISGKRNDPAGGRAELLISNWPLECHQDATAETDS